MHAMKPVPCCAVLAGVMALPEEVISTAAKLLNGGAGLHDYFDLGSCAALCHAVLCCAVTCSTMLPSERFRMYTGIQTGGMYLAGAD